MAKNVQINFQSTLIFGRLIRRYKRFFADIETEEGEVITAHCPNTGSMQGVLTPGNQVWVSRSDNPKRKLSYTWELVEVDGTLIGVNTHNPNNIVHEALQNKFIPEITNYQFVKPEVKYGSENSRIDFLLTDHTGADTYLEVKNVHYSKTEQNETVAIFPDSETSRGVKHLQELIRVVEQGHRAIVLYCIQRNDCTALRFGWEFDPLYAKTALLALSKGIEMIPYSCIMTTTHIQLNKALKLLAKEPPQ